MQNSSIHQPATKSARPKLIHRSQRPATSRRRRRAELKIHHFNAKFMIYNTEFIIFNRKFT